MTFFCANKSNTHLEPYEVRTSAMWHAHVKIDRDAHVWWDVSRAVTSGRHGWRFLCLWMYQWTARVTRRASNCRRQQIQDNIDRCTSQRGMCCASTTSVQVNLTVVSQLLKPSSEWRHGRKSITITALEFSATLIPVVAISRTRDPKMDPEICQLLGGAARRSGHHESPVQTLQFATVPVASIPINFSLDIEFWGCSFCNSGHCSGCTFWWWHVTSVSPPRTSTALLTVGMNKWTFLFTFCTDYFWSLVSEKDDNNHIFLGWKLRSCNRNKAVCHLFKMTPFFIPLASLLDLGTLPFTFFEDLRSNEHFDPFWEDAASLWSILRRQHVDELRWWIWHVFLFSRCFRDTPVRVDASHVFWFVLVCLWSSVHNLTQFGLVPFWSCEVFEHAWHFVLCFCCEPSVLIVRFCHPCTNRENSSKLFMMIAETVQELPC